jgi:hypothetical protein
LTDKLYRHPRQEFQLSQIVFDDKNPNVMTEAQEKGLSKSHDQLGILEDLIIREKDNLCVDGEHRAKDAIKKGEKTYPAIILKEQWIKDTMKAMKLKEADVVKIFIRQVKNKLHGQHQAEKEQMEFMIVQNDDGSKMLSEFLGQPEEQVIVKFTDEKAIDQNIMNDRADSFLEGSIKQIYLFFSNEDYENIIPRLKELMTRFDVDNHTDLVKKLVEHAENNNS